MLRKYIHKRNKKRPHCSYDPADMEKAVCAYRAGEGGFIAVAKKYGVKKSTLRDKVNNFHPKHVGGQLAVPPKIEQMLASALKQVATWGFPLDREELKEIVKSILDA